MENTNFRKIKLEELNEILGVLGIQISKPEIETSNQEKPQQENDPILDAVCRFKGRIPQRYEQGDNCFIRKDAHGRLDIVPFPLGAICTGKQFNDYLTELTRGANKESGPEFSPHTRASEARLHQKAKSVAKAKKQHEFNLNEMRETISNQAQEILQLKKQESEKLKILGEAIKHQEQEILRLKMKVSFYKVFSK